MAIYKNTPPIVTNGLVLSLDAANVKSYPKTGTTWNDLSGNNNTGTLTNGPTFNNDNGGSIVFDGTNDYSEIPNSTSLQVGATFTINCWIRPGRLDRRETIFSTRQTDAAGSWMLEVGIANANTNTIAITGPGTWIFVAINNSISLNTWINISFVRTDNSTVGKMYVNKNEVASQQTTSYNIANNSNFKYIGAARSTDNFFTGNISNLQIYNRALSATEVLQNYNALKSRFGL